MPGKGQRSGKMMTCGQCHAEIYAYPSRPRKFCSASCAMKYRNSLPTNPCYHRDISGNKNPMYGKGMKGPKNPMYGLKLDKCPSWKGGKKHRPDGYVRIVVPPDYPAPCDHGSTGTAYALEHRVVMEKHLGRYLERREVVHHINGDPSDNNIDNLQLFESQSDHISIGHSKWQ